MTPHDLVRERTVLSVVVGSRAFGLDVDGSDTDVRSVFLAPTASLWSLTKPPTHVDGPEPERFSWELERFCELALRTNPNLVEVLHSPLVQQTTPIGRELLAHRSAFLSRHAHGTYSGYVRRQFEKMASDARGDGVRWKRVMHLLRLLLSGESLLRTGVPMVDVGEHRDLLLAVRRGEVAFEDVERLRLRLHAQMDAALPDSPLPEQTDHSRVDAWLVDVRRRDLDA